MSLEQGSRVFVAYDLPGPQLFHERLVLAPCACQRGWHVVLTPDGDIYEELLSLKNSDLAAFHLAPPGEDSLPYGVTHANSYRFLRRPPADQMAQLLRDARHAAAAFLLLLGRVLQLPYQPQRRLLLSRLLWEALTRSG